MLPFTPRAARQPGGVAGGAQRRRALRQAARVRVPEAEAGVRPAAGGGAHPPGPDDLAADHAVEPAGLAGDLGHADGDSGRGVADLRAAALSEGVGRPHPRADARHRRLSEPDRDGGRRSRPGWPGIFGARGAAPRRPPRRRRSTQTPARPHRRRRRPAAARAAAPPGSTRWPPRPAPTTTAPSRRSAPATGRSTARRSARSARRSSGCGAHDAGAHAGMRLKLTLEYAGTRYSGWQVQQNARTVQGEVEKAIREATGADRFELLRLGPHRRRRARARPGGAPRRPRAGCRPRRCAAASTTRCPPTSTCCASRPPRRGSTPGTTRWRAATSTRWRGAGRRSPSRSCGGSRTTATPSACARPRARFVGFHDFRAFSDDDPAQKSTTVHARVVRRARGRGPRRACTSRRSHFLWKMVRRLVGVLVEVGRGRDGGAATPRRSSTPTRARWRRSRRRRRGCSWSACTTRATRATPRCGAPCGSRA